MAYDFSHLKERIAEVHDWLQKEYQTIRTGRATPAILDNVKVEAYGSSMPVNQLANIGTEDAKTLRITPWDPSQITAIEKAISDADLGLSVNVDEQGLRAIFPDLTAERREQLSKLAKQKLEDARVSLRNAREETWDNIQKQKKEGEITEDDMYRLKEQMEKMVQEAQDELEGMEKKKEQEISE